MTTTTITEVIADRFAFKRITVIHDNIQRSIKIWQFDRCNFQRLDYLLFLPKDVQRRVQRWVTKNDPKEGVEVKIVRDYKDIGRQIHMEVEIRSI